VADDEKYCSDYCKTAGTEDVEISCDCGHPGCSLAETEGAAVPGEAAI
jgi:hypothetical protein